MPNVVVTLDDRDFARLHEVFAVAWRQHREQVKRGTDALIARGMKHDPDAPDLDAGQLQAARPMPGAP